MTSPAYLLHDRTHRQRGEGGGFARRIGLSVRTWRTFIPRSKLPEQIRMKATRSRCALSMFAWILKTNALKGSVLA